MPERAPRQGYAPDPVRQKFTGYERDAETGLDFAQARYYLNSQGRFTSPDPLLASGKSGQPQSWNRYTYCLNNPLAYIDPDGLIWGRATDKDGNQTGSPVWYKDEDEMRAKGATAFTPPLGIYKAANDRWVQLNLNGPGEHSAELAALGANPTAGWAYNDNPGPPFVINDPPVDMLEGQAVEAAVGGVAGKLITSFAGRILRGIFARGAGEVAEEAVEGGVQSFQRVMSTAELEATQATNLLRGGREGTNFFTNAASLDAKRAQIRLGLDGPLRDVRMTFSITNDVRVFGPQRAFPGRTGTPGGGREFFTNGPTRVNILQVDLLRK